MIFGNIDNLGNQENYSPIILEALEILKSGKWNNVENGKYEIKGEEMFIMISSYETGDEEGKFAEAHKKYLDVQFIQEGVEAIKVTKFFRKWQLYVGAENLGNFTQDNPIIAGDDPFGQYFDGSMVWGPLMGRRFYAGIRVFINRD